MSQLRRDVGCFLDLDVTESGRAALMVAVAPRPGLQIEEMLRVAVDGTPLEVQRLDDPDHGTSHVFTTRPGRLSVRYEATVTGRAEPPTVDELERWTYLHPSRYAPSDAMVGIASTEFSGSPHDSSLLATVAAWVGTRLAYVPGSSGPTDGAVDTLLSGQGVCRDYAHLTLAMLRALDVPARLVSAYAPGLSPMDFHAVVEAYLDGIWQVADATLLAARSTLLRISTGRDATDTAFLTTAGGGITLTGIEVWAVSDPDPEYDDLAHVVRLG